MATAVCGTEGCGATSGLALCGGCHAVAYCPPPATCQRDAWRAHKRVCKEAAVARTAVLAAVAAFRSECVRKPAVELGLLSLCSAADLTPASAEAIVLFLAGEVCDANGLIVLASSKCLAAMAEANVADDTLHRVRDALRAGVARLTTRSIVTSSEAIQYLNTLAQLTVRLGGPPPKPWRF